MIRKSKHCLVHTPGISVLDHLFCRHPVCFLLGAGHLYECLEQAHPSGAYCLSQLATEAGAGPIIAGYGKFCGLMIQPTGAGRL